MQRIKPLPPNRVAAAGVRAIAVMTALPVIYQTFDLRAMCVLLVPSLCAGAIVRPIRQGNSTAILFGQIGIALLTLLFGITTPLWIIETFLDWRHLQFERISALIGLGLCETGAACLVVALVTCNVHLWRTVPVRQTANAGHGFLVELPQPVLPLDAPGGTHNA